VYYEGTWGHAIEEQAWSAKLMEMQSSRKGTLARLNLIRVNSRGGIPRKVTNLVL
jgi:hypothetical protein